MGKYFIDTQYKKEIMKEKDTIIFLLQHKDLKKIKKI